MVPNWVAKYVGLPFKDHGRTIEDGVDCWGLVRLVLKDQYGFNLPDYGDRYLDTDDKTSVPNAFFGGALEQDEWVKVDSPQIGDVLLLNIGGKPMHCGIVVDARMMLHARSVSGSVLDQYDRPTWNRRVEGVYRHRSRC